MQRQAHTPARLSPYFAKGISHSLRRDRREAVSFLRLCNVSRKGEQMKKLILWSAAVLPSLMFAESIKVGDITYYYRIIGDGVEIANPYDLGGSWPHTPLGDDFAVPETIDGKPVVSIGDNAFCGANVNSLSVPDSVTNIGVSAIGGAGISEFKIPSKLVRIGARAFSGCVYLTELELPSSLKVIEEGAFSASGLTKLSLPDGITEIPPDMCDGCSKIGRAHV